MIYFIESAQAWTLPYIHYLNKKNVTIVSENKYSKKKEQLNEHSIDYSNKPLTTRQGVKVNDTNNSLKAGERGATLLEDFLLREKFDHERITERIVHARGSGTHGYFELYESIEKYSKAGIFTDTEQKTPVFVRFSTVAGSNEIEV